MYVEFVGEGLAPPETSLQLSKIKYDATGGASKASDKCSIAKISENNKDWCNGRGKPLPYKKQW